MTAWPKARAFIALFAITAALAVPASAKDNYERVVPLLDTTTTVLGQPHAYPKGEAKVTSAIVTMMPGEETGIHFHPVPTYGYILDGELTVSYPGGVEKTYRKGQAVMEAVGTLHNGKNLGTGPVRILVVSMGVVGKSNTLFPKDE
ncbi:cupin domain-containing protein [Hoeflea prorocentri]|uniref:Cupin domain-containing protein n=1 Tax=Hoeflea prorocentri TaxID=1922333 RepID=A0A9X3UL90_9HYPH|nr:cupin domain-containing protein [Hoeflea prorocentri]MCY6383328.1 cupin domain-containing protein [Hoeflea prorocentri]MDA5401128.1 cupin domain-containing protein [Hoeflea prorocentri]